VNKKARALLDPLKGSFPDLDWKPVDCFPNFLAKIEEHVLGLLNSQEQADKVEKLILPNNYILRAEGSAGEVVKPVALLEGLSGVDITQGLLRVL